MGDVAVTSAGHRVLVGFYCTVGVVHTVLVLLLTQALTVRRILHTGPKTGGGIPSHLPLRPAGLLLLRPFPPVFAGLPFEEALKLQVPPNRKQQAVYITLEQTSLAAFISPSQG